MQPPSFEPSDIPEDVQDWLDAGCPDTAEMRQSNWQWAARELMIIVPSLPDAIEIMVNNLDTEWIEQVFKVFVAAYISSSNPNIRPGVATAFVDNDLHLEDYGYPAPLDQALTGLKQLYTDKDPNYWTEFDAKVKALASLIRFDSSTRI